MAGALRSKYLLFLTLYAYAYAAFVFGAALLDVLNIITLPMPVLAVGLALLPVLYHLLVFNFAVQKFGQQVAYLIGVALLSIPMAVISTMTGGYASPNNLAIIVLVFSSAVLGPTAPLALLWMQLMGLVMAAGGYLPALGSTTLGVFMILLYSLAGALGWMIFRGFYTRESPDTDQLRQTLRQERLQSEGLITAISDGVSIISKDGVVLHANEKFLEMVALTAEQMIGKHYTDVVTSRVRISASTVDSPRIGPNVRKVLETGVPVIIESETVDYLDGRPSLDMSVSITALKNDDNQISAVMIISRDITHLMNLQRMKDALIMTASHELRTPITVIAGYADLLLGGTAGKLNDKQRHYMERTKETTEHLTEMVNDMLDISRLESGQRDNKPKLLDITVLLEDIIETHLSHFAGKQQTLQLEGDGGQVYADESRLREVMGCLLSNAQKFSPEEGKVTIRVKRQGTMVDIGVEDTGPGVPEESRRMIFEKFTKLDDTGSIDGAGLGLAIAEIIVDNWGGTIAVENSPEGGASFHFTVPGDEPQTDNNEENHKEEKS
jgi:PAS domain S-box-containing protein